MIFLLENKIQSASLNKNHKFAQNQRTVYINDH